MSENKLSTETGTFSKIDSPGQVKYAADLEPLLPHDPRYVPLEDVRQDNVPRDLYRVLKAAVGNPKGKPAHLCYAGHRGNGKTTELNMVMEKLEKESLFYFVYRAADADLATSDLDYPDIMLYLAKMALEGMPKNIELDDNLLKPIEQWFASRVAVDESYKDSQIEIKSSVGSGFNIPGLLQLLASITSSIKGGHKSMMETRHVLRQQVSDLINRMNELFHILRQSLEKAGKPRELALVVDNLDRLPPDVMENAFNKWASLFNQLKVHLVMTVPLPLIYYPEGTKLSEMGFRPLVLSMPKIRQRFHGWDESWNEGVDKLIEVIKARVQVGKVFAGKKEDKEKSIRRIVMVSGGALRDMMHILTYAGEEAWDKPISGQHVETAVHKVRNELMSNLNSEDIQILVKIHKEKRADRTAKVGRQLHYRWALEYNGEKWADVHPIVFESDLFREALEAHDSAPNP